MKIASEPDKKAAHSKKRKQNITDRKDYVGNERRLKNSKNILLQLSAEEIKLILNPSKNIKIDTE